MQDSHLASIPYIHKHAHFPSTSKHCRTAPRPAIHTGAGPRNQEGSTRREWSCKAPGCLPAVLQSLRSAVGWQPHSFAGWRWLPSAWPPNAPQGPVRTKIVSTHVRFEGSDLIKCYGVDFRARDVQMRLHSAY
eukprot:503612-Pelagomonas_calceolata.AAC.5